MKPTKHLELIKKTAEELGLSEVFVSDIITLYWSEIKKNLTSLDYTHIYVPKFGTFKVKKWRIPFTIQSLQRANRKSRKRSNFAKIEELTALEKLDNLLRLFESQKTKTKLIKQKRNEFIENMERQTKDSGGDSK